MDFNTIANEFVQYYYKEFSSNRGSLKSLYRGDSMLTFEGEPFLGASAIEEKLTNLPFTKVEHKVTTLDAQPALPAGNIFVMVTGLLVVDDSPNPLQFSQAFTLARADSSYYVYNDAFRLNYG